MAKNRYNPVPDFTPKSERQPKEDEGLPLQPCIICQKMCEPYAYWEDGQTCSKDHEAIKESQIKLHGGEPCLKNS
jgi:hypothetical protein